MVYKTWQFYDSSGSGVSFSKTDIKGLDFVISSQTRQFLALNSGKLWIFTFKISTQKLMGYPSSSLLYKKLGGGITGLARAIYFPSDKKNWMLSSAVKQAIFWRSIAQKFWTLKLICNWPAIRWPRFAPTFDFQVASLLKVDHFYIKWVS